MASTFSLKRRPRWAEICNTGQISRGKTRILPRIDAGFTKCIPFADGRLGGHVPTGPGCICPAGRPGARRAYSSPSQAVLRTVCVRAQSYPVFVHRPAISPWACLPHPASRRRTCPLPNLRLCEYLVSGLSPDWIRAMHGTHVRKQKSPVDRGFQGCFLDRTGQSKTHLWRSGRDSNPRPPA